MTELIWGCSLIYKKVKDDFDVSMKINININSIKMKTMYESVVSSISLSLGKIDSQIEGVVREFFKIHNKEISKSGKERGDLAEKREGIFDPNNLEKSDDAFYFLMELLPIILISDIFSYDSFFDSGTGYASFNRENIFKKMNIYEM